MEGALAYPQLLEAGEQVFLRAVALDSVATAAEQLQIVKVVRATPGLRQHVVNLKMPDLKVCTAARTVTRLLAV